MQNHKMSTSTADINHIVLEELTHILTEMKTFSHLFESPASLFIDLTN